MGPRPARHLADSAGQSRGAGHRIDAAGRGATLCQLALSGPLPAGEPLYSGSGRRFQYQLLDRPCWNDMLGATAGLSSSAENTGGQATRATRQFRLVGPLGQLEKLIGPAPGLHLEGNSASRLGIIRGNFGLL